MASISKRVSGSWVSGSYGIMETATDTITTLPTVIYPTITTATVGLKGNTVQSTTPSPDNPIMPQGTGERTGNLFDDFDIVGQVPSVSNGNLVNYTNGACTDLIELSSGLLVLSIYETMVVYVFLYDTNKSFLGWVNLSSAGTQTTQQITNYENAKYARVRTDNYSAYLNEKKIMLNTGSTALPYESYGIKTPISSANTTTPIYLGEVQTTRKVKKLVLDGTESWSEGASNYYIFINVSGRDGIPNSTALSTHSESGVVVNNNGTALFFKKSVFVHSSLADFKTYLQQQYAAGTPVTVWYVLATEKTAVVNEPLMKIGDYADEVSNISIPVTAGGDTLSVETTVQPSGITATYKGWHPVADVHERDNGAWT